MVRNKKASSNNNKAFTLVELLVVISIIALLMSILMPSLQKARNMGMRAVCLSNLHQLGLAWTIYSTNNDDKIVDGNTWTEKQGTLPAKGMADAWVGWSKGAIVIPTKEATREKSAFQQSIKMQHESIEYGALFSYTEDYDVYKCPVGRPGNERTYSIVDSMNGWDPGVWAPQYPKNPRVYRRIAQIKRPAEKLLLLDCGEQSYASWTLGDKAIAWMEPVQTRHSTGTTFGFTDGHSEYWKWESKNTKGIGELSMFEFYQGGVEAKPTSGWGVSSLLNGSDPNPDFLRIQKGMWGRTY